MEYVRYMRKIGRNIYINPVHRWMYGRAHSRDGCRRRCRGARRAPRVAGPDYPVRWLRRVDFMRRVSLVYSRGNTVTEQPKGLIYPHPLVNRAVTAPYRTRRDYEEETMIEQRDTWA